MNEPPPEQRIRAVSLDLAMRHISLHVSARVPHAAAEPPRLSVDVVPLAKLYEQYIVTGELDCADPEAILAAATEHLRRLL